MKMEQGADTFNPPVSQAGNTIWTEAELAIIDEMVGVRCTKDMIRKAFPNRTIQAVKMKLYEIRRADHTRVLKGNGGRPSNGVNPLHPDDPGVEDSWFVRHQRDMRNANDAFLSALQKSFA
jgi:hypothetical protein